jgi:hypothetical protein
MAHDDLVEGDLVRLAPGRSPGCHNSHRPDNLAGHSSHLERTDPDDHYCSSP